MNLDIPSIIRLVIVFLAWIFCIVGISTPQITITWNAGNGVGGNFNVFLGNGGLITTGCSGYKSRLDAAYAFSILAVLALSAGLVLLVLCLVAMFVALLERFTRLFKLGALLASIIAVVCLIIAWPVSASVYDSEICNSRIKNVPNAKLGAGFAMLIVAFVFVIADVVVGILTAVLGMFGGGGMVNPGGLLGGGAAADAKQGE